MLVRLCQKHRHLLQHRPRLWNIATRLIFSESNTWTGTYENEMRLKVERRWKDSVSEVEAHYLQEQGEFSSGFLNRLNSFTDDSQTSKTVKGKEKFYVLSMFPYPSGHLHLGHVRVYTISDVMARYHRMKGRHVIHPMGWDAFGLPAENAAIDRGERPDTWTEKNIEAMREQLEPLNLSFDWSREISTCDPEYYRWTQHLFLMLYKKGLVYRKEAAVNWDPVDQTVLADEQVNEQGESWRSGAKVEKRFLNQWYIRTTKYAKSLYEGLSEVNTDFWRDVVKLQTNWFGEPTGALFKCIVEKEYFEKTGEELMAFASAPHAIFGASHIVISPDHFLWHRAKNEPGKYVDLDKDVVRLELTAVHPLGGLSLPIYVSKTFDLQKQEAKIGIPCADEKDMQFANDNGIHCYDIYMKEKDGSVVLQGSDVFTMMDVKEVTEPICEMAQRMDKGGYRCSDRFCDWLISRQRYWGTPIPIIHCPVHGAVPVEYDDLPVLQPRITDKNLGKGKTPATDDLEWLQAPCPKCGKMGKRETDTMDTFVDSSWYFLRYLDPFNDERPFDKNVAEKMMPVDLYIGGKEHAILHLYFARFISHFLYDEGLLPCREPFVNLLTQGVIKGQTFKVEESGKYLPKEDVTIKKKGTSIAATETSTGLKVTRSWEKMSKSKFNGVDPQSLIEEHGSDALRLFVLTNVSPQSDRNWGAEDGVYKGVWKWQRRMWNIVSQFRSAAQKPAQPLSRDVLDIYEARMYQLRNEQLTQVNFAMEKTYLLNNAITRLQMITKNIAQSVPAEAFGQSVQLERAACDLIIMLAPLAPMLASELWAGMQTVPHLTDHYRWDKGVMEQDWPVVDADFHLALTVQKNGKVVYELKLPVPIGQEKGFSKEDAVALAETHVDYTHVMGEDPIQHVNFVLVPGYSAFLEYTTKETKKKTKFSAIKAIKGHKENYVKLINKPENAT